MLMLSISWSKTLVTLSRHFTIMPDSFSSFEYPLYFLSSVKKYTNTVVSEQFSKIRRIVLLMFLKMACTSPRSPSLSRSGISKFSSSCSTKIRIFLLSTFIIISLIEQTLFAIEIKYFPNFNGILSGVLLKKSCITFDIESIRKFEFLSTLSAVSLFFVMTSLIMTNASTLPLRSPYFNCLIFRPIVSRYSSCSNDKSS